MIGGKITSSVLAAAALLTLSSCEDKELAAKNTSQKARIVELEAEVETQKRLLGDEPEGDPVGELKAAEGKLAETQEAVKNLEEELATLRAQRESLEETFESYKRKFPVEN